MGSFRFFFYIPLLDWLYHGAVDIIIISFDHALQLHGNHVGLKPVRIARLILGNLLLDPVIVGHNELVDGFDRHASVHLVVEKIEPVVVDDFRRKNTLEEEKRKKKKEVIKGGCRFRRWVSFRDGGRVKAKDKSNKKRM